MPGLLSNSLLFHAEDDPTDTQKLPSRVKLIYDGFEHSLEVSSRGRVTPGEVPSFLHRCFRE